MHSQAGAWERGNSYLSDIFVLTFHAIVSPILLIENTLAFILKSVNHVPLHV